MKAELLFKLQWSRERKGDGETWKTSPNTASDAAQTKNITIGDFWGYWWIKLMKYLLTAIQKKKFMLKFVKATSLILSKSSSR